MHCRFTTAVSAVTRFNGNNFAFYILQVEKASFDTFLTGVHVNVYFKIKRCKQDGYFYVSVHTVFMIPSTVPLTV